MKPIKKKIIIENKIHKVRRISRLPKLKKELENKNGLDRTEKDIILTWINSAYEIGLKDAGDIIGKNISKAVDKELKDLNQKNE